MKRKWTGIIKQDLRSYGRALEGLPPEHKKGDLVIVRKSSIYDKNDCRTGEYEFHYTDKDDKNFVRTSKFLIETEEDE